jgi:hypothetical protein
MLADAADAGIPLPIELSRSVGCEPGDNEKRNTPTKDVEG